MASGECSRKVRSQTGVVLLWAAELPYFLTDHCIRTLLGMESVRNLTTPAGTLGSGTRGDPKAVLRHSVALLRKAALDEADLREFARLWQHEFGEALPFEEAEREASRLLELYLTLYTCSAEPTSSGPSDRRHDAS